MYKAKTIISEIMMFDPLINENCKRSISEGRNDLDFLRN